ncbi:MAG: substrate-binding domain-containing protein [Opitutales bacterium]|nr:substrate-binding domain-containing protein [Opitutales bacterium]
MKMNLKFFTTLSFLSLAVLSGNAAVERTFEGRQDIVCRGSDFWAGAIETAFAEQVWDACPRYNLKSELRGSRWAMNQLRSGKCDFVIALLPDKKTVPEIVSGAWKAIPVAYQTAVVVVAKSNTLDQISFYQLNGIFSRYPKERIDRWNQLASDFDGLTQIRRLINLEQGSSTAAFFQSKISVNNLPLVSEVEKYYGNDATLREVNYHSIAIVPSFNQLKYPGLKTLAVSAAMSKDEPATAYAPSLGNIAHGDYPLAVPFYFVYPADKRETILPILSVAVSDKFSKVVESHGYAVPPKNQRLAIQNQIQKYFDEKSEK